MFYRQKVSVEATEGVIEARRACDAVRDWGLQCRHRCMRVAVASRVALTESDSVERRNVV